MLILAADTGRLAQQMIKHDPETILPFRFISRMGYVVASLLAVLVSGCAGPHPAPNVVAIVNVTATETSRGIHAGIVHACKEVGFTRYWNAPTHMDDYERQIELMDRHLSEATAGLVLLPNNPTAPLSEVIKARDIGKPIVLLHTALAVDPGAGVYLVLSDMRATARLAVEQLYAGAPSGMGIALMGLSTEDLALMRLEQSFRDEIRSTHPKAHISVVTAEGPTPQLVEEMLTSMLRRNPGIGAVFALDDNLLLAAVKVRQDLAPATTLRLVGAQTSPTLEGLVRTGEVDSLIVEDRYAMGEVAVRILAALRNGAQVPRSTYIQPLLLPRRTIDLPAVAGRPPFNGRDR